MASPAFEASPTGRNSISKSIFLSLIPNDERTICADVEQSMHFSIDRTAQKTVHFETFPLAHANQQEFGTCGPLRRTGSVMTVSVRHPDEVALVAHPLSSKRALAVDDR